MGVFLVSTLACAVEPVALVIWLVGVALSRVPLELRASND